MTVTEALAEVKTNAKKIQKKSETLMNYIWRPESLKDPLEKQGGSIALVREERQSIRDLLERNVAIRSAIAESNMRVTLTIGGVTRTIEQWLVWRRDVAPIHQNLLHRLRLELTKAHNSTLKTQVGQGSAEKPSEVTINLDEAAFAKEVETLEDTLGQLDGLLSLKNATIQILL